MAKKKKKKNTTVVKEVLNFLVFLVRHSKMYKLVFEQMFSFVENKSNSLKKESETYIQDFFLVWGVCTSPVII